MLLSAQSLEIPPFTNFTLASLMIPQIAVVMKTQDPFMLCAVYAGLISLNKLIMPTESFSKAMWVKNLCLLQYAFSKRQVNILVEHIGCCHGCIVVSLGTNS